jgi:hypothetical protein
VPWLSSLSCSPICDKAEAEEWSALATLSPEIPTANKKLAFERGIIFLRTQPNQKLPHDLAGNNGDDVPATELHAFMGRISRIRAKLVG